MEENISREGERVSVLQGPVSDFPLSVRSANILRGIFRFRQNHSL